MMFGLFSSKFKHQAKKRTDRVVWACDYCTFVFYDEEFPYLEMQDYRTQEAFITVGKGDEFGEMDTSTVEVAIQSGLDILHSQGVTVTYNDKTDDELGYSFGEYGSNPEWLNSPAEIKAQPTSPKGTWTE